MELFEKDWITQPPFDYESKHYKLLSMIGDIESLIADNKLYSAMQLVGSELEKLYNLKYNEDVFEMNNSRITGIDTETMSLTYEHIEGYEDMQVVYDICDDAIYQFEQTYKQIIYEWRKVESECIITEIPDKKPLNSMGYVMYIVPTSDIIQIYKYIEPSSFKIDWNNFRLVKVCEIENTLRKISEFIVTSESKSDHYRFFRFDVKIKDKIPPFNECMLPIMQFSLFNKIKHGF